MTPIRRSQYLQFSLNVAYYRKLLGLTQAQLAEKMHISRTYISYIEAPNMQISIPLDTLFDLSEALGISPSKLLEFRD